MTDTEDRQVLYKVIRNSILWDACVLEAYEGDVQELIENILFAGFTKRPQANALAETPTACSGEWEKTQ